MDKEVKEMIEKFNKVTDSFNESLVKFNTYIERADNKSIEDKANSISELDKFAKLISERFNDIVIVVDTITTIILGAKIIEPENFQMILEQIRKKYETMEKEHGKAQHQTDSNGTQETKQDIRPDNQGT